MPLHLIFSFEPLDTRTHNCTPETTFLTPNLLFIEVLYFQLSIGPLQTIPSIVIYPCCEFHHLVNIAVIMHYRPWQRLRNFGEMPNCSKMIKDMKGCYGGVAGYGSSSYVRERSAGSEEGEGGSVENEIINIPIPSPPPSLNTQTLLTPFSLPPHSPINEKKHPPLSHNQQLTPKPSHRTNLPQKREED